MTQLGRRQFLNRFLASSSLTVGASTLPPILSLLLSSCARELSPLDSPASTSDSAGSSTDSSPASPEAASATDNDAIKVGLLHSLSGPMAISEAPLVEAERMAIDDINASGGLIGKQLVAVIEDGASDWPTFAEKAEKLIDQQQIAVLFGGFTSASRKAMLPVVKAKNCLLWYPNAYEGQECAAQIFYAGASANQQVEPAVDWLLSNRGKSFFLVSDSARTLHELIKSQLKAKGGQVAGEAYIPFDKTTQPDMVPVMAEIKKALPDGGIIFNSLMGDANRFFFKALQGAGLSTDKYLVMSAGVGEEEVFQIGPSLLEGHYAAMSYFQTLDSPANKDWVKAFQSKYGADRVVGAPEEAAYVMVRLWAQAVAAARSLDSTAVSNAAYGQSFAAPSGTVTVQPNHHVTQAVHIGKVQADGQFEILMAKEAIAPNPWSQYAPDSKGFACDWSDPTKGAKYSLQTADS